MDPDVTEFSVTEVVFLSLYSATLKPFQATYYVSENE